MKIQPLLVALTIVNAAMLTVSLAIMWPSRAQGVTPVLRGRALEIVDARGRLRASISVIPADPNYRMPDGTTGYKETVLFRLIDPNGQPNVKIQAVEDGAGLGLGGAEPTYVAIEAENTTSLSMTNRDGKMQVITP